MKKLFNIYMLLLVFYLPIIGFSQTQITLIFVGRDAITQNLIPLDSVNVNNLSEGCDTLLSGPVPVFSFVALWPVGINDGNNLVSNAFVLKQNYPNPFQGSTVVNIYREYSGTLNLMLFDALGTKLVENQNEFEKGYHSFVVSSSGNKVLILSVFDEKNNRSIKIISAGQGNEGNSIQYLGQTQNIGNNSLKNVDNSGFVYYLGNQMKYTAHSTGYNEKILIDSPETDSTYYFDMTMFYLPSVTTNAVTNITQTTATSGGSVTSDGGATVTARGVCWSTSSNPTIANSHTTDGSGTGTFISYLTGLTANTPYYLRAYATNSVGTGYGNEVSFTTGQTITPPVVTTASVTNIAQTSAISGGTVVLDGGATVTARGVCWSTNPNPTTAGSYTIDGTGTGTFVSYITGLTGSTQYYIRAYATNSAGTSYGNELSFTTLTLPIVSTTAVTNIAQTTASSGGTVSSDGGATVTARGVCWSTSSNPTLANSYTIDGTGTGIFISNLTGLSGGTQYYVRAYATNSVGTAYGNELTFTTLTLPIVSTAAVTNVAQTTATSGGTVSSDGGATVTARGVCWGTSSGPTITGNHTTDGTGTGSFVSSLTGLTGSTLYYVRAYATNSVGTSYGNELIFTTLSLASVNTAEISNPTQTTATSGGIVTSEGLTAVTAKGVCWDITTTPTVAGNHTNDGSGIGAFISNITGLTQGTFYYVRAYATNSDGTAYGNEVTFTTLQPCPGVPSVTYEGKTYNTLLVGTQCWLKENLNVGNRINGTQGQLNNGVKEKYCYNDLESNCDVYGGLYQWNEMMQYLNTPGVQGICPTGWHLPTDEEWTTLTNYLGGESIAGGKMKEVGTAHWSPTNTGATNISGFTALPGGFRYFYGGGFYMLNGTSYFWSSSESGAPGAWYRSLSFANNIVSRTLYDKSGGYSVRCIKY